jgi:polyisoprenoid-binding protein YceI
MKKIILYFFLLLIFTVLIGYGVSKINRPQIISENNPSIKSTAEISPDNTVIENTPQLKIDLQKSNIIWNAKKTLVTTNNHTGTIKFKEGFVNLQEGVLTGGEFTLDMNTISSTDLTGTMKKKLEDHLKSEDFFAVTKFPISQLIIKQVARTENSQIMIIGDLTIKDITHEIDFPATFTTNENNYSIKADFEIDRTLWDIRFGSGKFFDNLGDNIIDDIIGLSLEISIPQN